MRERGRGSVISSARRELCHGRVETLLQLLALAGLVRNRGLQARQPLLEVGAVVIASPDLACDSVRTLRAYGLRRLSPSLAADATPAGVSSPLKKSPVLRDAPCGAPQH